MIRKNEIAKIIIPKYINQIINVENTFKQNGFKIFLNKNKIEIIYKNKQYYLIPFCKNGKYYWQLKKGFKILYNIEINDSINDLKLIINKIKEINLW